MIFGEQVPIQKQNRQIRYNDIVSMEALTRALNRTKTNKIPGIDGISKKEFDPEQLIKLAHELKSQKYRPKPTKRVGIPKPNGGTRYLGLSSQRDKVVQASLLVALEEVLEPTFSQLSFGFRKRLGCHHALKEIKMKWQNVVWVINIDISKFFDTIHHDILIRKVSQYCDQATTELVIKLIKAGYVDIFNLANSEERLTKGTPQGSLISPILSNLYLDELDKFVEQQLLKVWNRGDSRPMSNEYRKHTQLSDEDKEFLAKFPELRDEVIKVKHNRWVKQGLPSKELGDPNFRRLHYVRYADDFILGYVGPKEEAEKITMRIKEFLHEHLSLETNPDKSTIKHASERGIKYLGVYLRYLPNNRLRINSSSEKGDVKLLKATSYNSAQLRAPIVELMEKAVNKGYAKRSKSGIARATACIKMSSLEDEQIVNRFSKIIRGILEYYSCVNSRSDLWNVIALYKKSCALTLAHKHKLRSANEVFKRYGPKLKVSNPLGKGTTELYYPTTLGTKIDFKTRKDNITMELLNESPLQGSYMQNPKTSLVCQFEGCKATEKLEEHHTNPLRNISKQLTAFEKSLIAKKRKTITLCQEHHKTLHGKRVI